jgi:hypothetical protein
MPLAMHDTTDFETPSLWTITLCFTPWSSSCLTRSTGTGGFAVITLPFVCICRVTPGATASPVEKTSSRSCTDLTPLECSGDQRCSDASSYGNGVPVANPHSARTGSNGAAFLWAALCYFFA